MPIRVIESAPNTPWGARFMRWILRAVGAVLVLVGVLVGTLPLAYVVFTIEAAISGRDVSAPEGRLFAIAALAWLSIYAGLRLIRGRRRLALFLRRFGFEDATEALTFALGTAMGGSWRMVTLDDQSVAPSGVRKGLSRLLVVVTILAATLCAWGFAWLFGDGFDSAIGGVFDGPLETSSPSSLVGELLGRFIGALVVGLILVLVVLIPAVSAGMLAFLAGGARLAVRRANHAKAVQIDAQSDIEPQAHAVLRASRRILAPRLVVARVANPIWQDTVRRLARESAAIVIDVSDPGESLLWEIETLAPEAREHWVLVGRADRVAALAAPTDSSTAPLVARLRQLLDGEELLPYRDEAQDRKRFAKVLRRALDRTTRYART